MYLDSLILKNFRKYENLEVKFQKWLNVLIWMNDAGKTAIIDAIKILLKTHSNEWIRIEEDDFRIDTNELKIEAIIKWITEDEAINFIEWLWINKDEKWSQEIYLRLILNVRKEWSKILPYEVKAGLDESGSSLSAEAKDLLKSTYLKPLRDAENELIPKKYSRLSKILAWLEWFKWKEENHVLKEVSICFNCLTQKYFDKSFEHEKCPSTWNCKLNWKFTIPDKNWSLVQNTLDNSLKDLFWKDSINANFSISDKNLKDILEIIKLWFDQDGKLWLWSQNLLYIAAEFLNLERDTENRIKLWLIEEIEAHLHPQAQLRIIEYLQSKSGEWIQLILTTHSPNLASKINIKDLIICHDNDAYLMWSDYTLLKEAEYKFLEKFLDVTKSNLFFAKWVILVEWWAEEILLPSLAKKIWINLVKEWISIVNIWNTGFSNYANIFKRKDKKVLNIPVSIITDLDLKPWSNTKDVETKISKKKDIFDWDKVKSFISKEYTLEYCLFKSSSLSDEFQKVVKAVHSWSNFNVFETDLLDKLNKKTLNKTEIAYKLAQRIDEDNTIIIKDDDEYLKYLLNAIKYAAWQ